MRTGVFHLSSRIPPLSSSVSPRINRLSLPSSSVTGWGYRYKSKHSNKHSKIPSSVSSSSSSSSITKPSGKLPVPSSVSLKGPLIPTIVPSIGTKRSRDALESSSSSSSAGLPPVPAVYTEAPMAIDIRRQMIEAQIIPPKYEESVGQKARRWSYFILGGIVGSIILGLYALSRTSSSIEELKIMEKLVQQLRIERKKAKKALIACVQQEGEIKMNSTTSIRWWATGPQNADIYIILVGTDTYGENAGIWGQVYAKLVRSLINEKDNINYNSIHDLLQNRSVRIVTFHHKNTSAESLPHKSSFSRSLTLGMHDIETLIQSIHKPSSSFVSSASLPQVLLVEQGEGTWRSLAYTGQHSSNTLGLVSVNPLYYHRGKRMVWLDALPQLSRQIPLHNQQSNTELIQTYLDPPPVTLSPEMQQFMDARTPRRIETIKFLQNIGFRTIDTSLTKRFAEDIRTKRASEPVLSDIENIILSASVRKLRLVHNQGGTESTRNLAPTRATASTAGYPIVRVVTYGADLLPSFIRPNLHNHAELYFLLAANTIGTFFLTDKEWEYIQDQRKKLIDVLVTKTLTHGPETTNSTTASTEMKGKDPSSKLTLPSLEDIIPQSYDGIQLIYALRMFPVWLGFVPVPKVEESLGYQSMEKELRDSFPSNFQVTLLHSSSEKKQHYPFGVASIPLQCSSSIVQEIMDVLAISLKGEYAEGTKNTYRHRDAHM